MIHNVFHVSLLEPAATNPFPRQFAVSPATVLINQQEEWEVSAILDSRRNHHVRGGVHYLVTWKGSEGTAEERSWEPFEALANAPMAVHDFHTLHPQKPRSSLLRGLCLAHIIP